MAGVKDIELGLRAAIFGLEKFSLLQIIKLDWLTVWDFIPFICELTTILAIWKVEVE